MFGTQNQPVRLDAATQALAGAFRLDVNETMFLQLQLEYLEQRTYEVRYPDLKARRFIPLSDAIPAGAATVAYSMWNRVGMAKVIHTMADDIPMVDASAQKFDQRVQSLANAYAYDLQDLRAAAFAGVNLEDQKARAARRAIEAGLDYIAAFGYPQGNMPGMLNHPNVPIVAVTTGNWAAGGATAAQVLADLRKLVSSIVSVSKGVEHPDTLLLPTDAFEYLAGLQAGADLTDTVLSIFMKTNTWIKNIDTWDRLDTASATGGPRAVAYRRSQEVLDLAIPILFETLPPQAVNLAFKVLCHARIGGTRIRYPLAMAYMDGI